VRGVPWPAPMMLRLRDLDDYEDAQLVRQKIAACFTAFVKDIEGIEASPTATKLAELERIEPGMIEYLAPGGVPNVTSLPGAEGYGDFTRAQLRAIAAGYGITFEALTGDYSQVNYSSGRMGRLEFQANVGVWQELMILSFCHRVWEWFYEAVQIAGIASGAAVCNWTPPKMPLLDPGKEIAAAKDGIKAGLLSWQDAQRGMGRDPEDVLNEIKQDYADFDDRGLVLDIDMRKSLAAKPAAAAATEKEDPEEPAGSAKAG
jgi:lambda family phage portal protein